MSRFGLRKLGLLTLLVVASSLASLLLAEAVLRWTTPAAYFVWSPGLQEVFRPGPDLMPGITGESRFFINELGLRGDTFSEAQTYRILALGGSTTECLYLDETEAWPRLVQEQLNYGRGEEQLTWVGNAGKSGLDTRHHIVQIERLLSQYVAIDAVLLLIGVNDLLMRLKLDRGDTPFPGVEQLDARAYDTFMSRAFSVWPAADSRHPSYERTELWRRLRILKRRYFDSLQPSLEQDRAGSIYETWRSYRENAASLRNALPDLSSALDAYAENVRSIVRIAQAKGVRVIFSTQPHMWRSGMPSEDRALLWSGGVGDYQEEAGHEYYSVEALADGIAQYNGRLLQTCREEHVECIDLERRIPKSRAVFYDAMHFNEAGSRRVAEILSEYLSQSLPPIARPPS